MENLLLQRASILAERDILEMYIYSKDIIGISLDHKNSKLSRITASLEKINNIIDQM